MQVQPKTTMVLSLEELENFSKEGYKVLQVVGAPTDGSYFWVTVAKVNSAAAKSFESGA
jgi:hypothetical protein